MIITHPVRVLLASVGMFHTTGLFLLWLCATRGRLAGPCP